MDLRFQIALQRQQKKRHRPRNHPPSATTQFVPHSPNQKIGQDYEEQAVAFLQEQGLVLLAQNLRCKMGELDAVMRDHEQLVFIEIRQRGSQRFGGALASITAAKRLRIRRTADFFLPRLSQQFFKNQTPLCRFDAVVFEGDEQAIVWLKHI